MECREGNGAIEFKDVVQGLLHKISCVLGLT
jgi:hypothetical protein